MFCEGLDTECVVRCDFARISTFIVGSKHLTNDARKAYLFQPSQKPDRSTPKSSHVCFNTNTHSNLGRVLLVSLLQMGQQMRHGYKKKLLTRSLDHIRGGVFSCSVSFMKFPFYSTICLFFSLANKYLSMVRSARLIRSADNIIFALTARSTSVVSCVSSS